MFRNFPRQVRTVPRSVLVVVVSAVLAAAGGRAASEASPAASTDEPGTSPQPRVHYSNELLVQMAVRDLDRSLAFYRDVLELPLASHEPELEWAKFETGMPGVRIGIGRQDSVTGSGTVSINIGVRDVDDARAVLETRGVKFTGPSVNIPGVVKLAGFQDPDGNRLRLAGPPDDDGS